MTEFCSNSFVHYMNTMSMMTSNMILNDLMGWPSGSLDCLLFVRQLGPGENFGVKENLCLMRLEI